VQQHCFLLARIHAVHRGKVDQQTQHASTLDVTQELMTEPATFTRTLDDSRDVGDDELGRFVQTHDAEVRFERGERIVGDLRLCSGDDTDERRLARVRETDECDVGHQLQFELQPTLLAVFTLFGELRRTSTIRQEAGIAATALTTAGRLEARTVSREIREYLTGVHVAHDGALGNLDDQVLSPTPVQVLAHSVHAISCTTMRMVAEREQRCNVVIGFQPDRATVAAVTTIRSAESNRTLTTETHAASTAVATANVQLGFIDEGTHRGFPCYG